MSRLEPGFRMSSAAAGEEAGGNFRRSGAYRSLRNFKLFQGKEKSKVG